MPFTWNELHNMGLLENSKIEIHGLHFWLQHMRKKTLQPPKELINIFSRSALIPEPKALGLVNDGRKFRQKGGRKKRLSL